MKQQTELIKYWESKGYFVINLVSTSKAGLPDLICIKPDKVILSESKEKWDSLSPLQKVWMRRLTRLGFDCYLNKKKINPTTEKTDLF